LTAIKAQIVFITGASSGIGEACARTFAREGCALILSARRIERVDRLATELHTAHGIRTLTIALDVRSRNAVEAAIANLPKEWSAIDILVNNAGLSRGLSKLYEAEVEDWEEMIDTNVKGLLYVSRAVVPGMVRRKRGHVINISSIAAHQTYPGGNVYCASKAAVRAITDGLKMDLLGTGVRVCAVSPGMVETEFSVVRYHGDEQRAAKTYENMKPLTGGDVADVVLFAATRPAHVDLPEIIIMSVDQASVYHVHRTEVKS
jgi:3-hydroxy acid dehydrogenase / malonic semialdehyde reductase